MERDRAELERRLELAVEELWCDDKDFRKVLDLFKEVVSCIEVGRRLPQAEDVCQGARKRLRKTIDLISGHGGPPDAHEHEFLLSTGLLRFAVKFFVSADTITKPIWLGGWTSHPRPIV